jgi:hypothetical protein
VDGSFVVSWDYALVISLSGRFVGYLAIVVNGTKDPLQVVLSLRLRNDFPPLSRTVCGATAATSKNGFGAAD